MVDCERLADGFDLAHLGQARAGEHGQVLDPLGLDAFVRTQRQCTVKGIEALTAVAPERCLRTREGRGGVFSGRL